jgi:hypothetical protein
MRRKRKTSRGFPASHLKERLSLGDNRQYRSSSEGFVFIGLFVLRKIQQSLKLQSFDLLKRLAGDPL